MTVWTATGSAFVACSTIPCKVEGNAFSQSDFCRVSVAKPVSSATGERTFMTTAAGSVLWGRYEL